jgi:hypothetical protein
MESGAPATLAEVALKVMGDSAREMAAVKKRAAVRRVVMISYLS